MAELQLVDDPEDTMESLPVDTGFGSYGPAPRQRIPKPSSEAEYEALPGGAAYISPEGERLTKKYKPKNKTEYDAIPEGAEYFDPEGTPRQKPKYEAVDFTANTLAHMAVNDREYRKALERSYPGKVRGTTREDMYVEDDNGVLRKPKGFTEAPGSFIAGIAAPTAGATAGSILGTTFGLPSGPGAVATGVLGATGGSIIGQTFNDAIMQLAGVYDRSLGEQAIETGVAAAAGAGGELIGRGVVAALPYAKEAVKNFASKRAAGFLGAKEEPGALRTALEISQEGEHPSSSKILRSLGMTDPGTEVPIATWAKESPHLANMEAWEVAFHKQNPLAQSASRYYERKAGDLLEQYGLTVPPGGVATPTAAPSIRETGQALLDKARNQAAQADEHFVTQLATRLAEVKAGVPAALETQQAVVAAHRADADAAKNLINVALRDVQADADAAMKVAKAGSDGGQLWQTAAEKLRAVEMGIDAKAGRYYNQFREASGPIPVNIGNVPEAAANLIGKLPENFKSQYPSLIQQVAKIAENKEPVDLTQLHNLRSVFRDKANWWSLESGIRNGELKYMAQQIDTAIQTAGKTPEHSMAVRLLNSTDDWYREERAIFNANVMDTIMKGIRSGEPADPVALLNVIAKEGRTDLTRKLMSMLGPETEAALKATDKQIMINNSKTLGFQGELDVAKFADQVLDRYQSGMLHTLHGEKGGDELFRVAQQIHALKGKIEIPAKPTDTALDILARGRMASEAITKEANQDPLKVLAKEMQSITKEQQAKLAEAQGVREKSPLGFLYNETVGANAAAKKILGSEDLIMATELQFGRNSPEFKMVQQSALERILVGTLDPSKKLEVLSKDAQDLLFPGQIGDSLQKLAGHMQFLTAKIGELDGVAMGMAALSKVEHPWATILGKGGAVARTLTSATKVAPGADAGGRFVLGEYYELARKFLSSPSFQRFVLKGLEGDEPARQQTRAQIQRMMQKGGALGAGIGESQEKTLEQNWQ